MNSKRCSYHHYHSGNSKSFRSSVPETRDENQNTYFLLYHNHAVSASSIGPYMKKPLQYLFVE